MNKYGINSDEADNEAYEFGKEFIRQQESSEPVTSLDIEFVLSVMIKEAPYDKQSIKQLFLGMLSAFTKLPIHHAVSSKDAGAGKSYLLVLVAGYIPKMYVVSLTGMSDKAMLHKEGTMVVEDDDGQPMPLDPMIEKLQEDKEKLNEELSNLSRNPVDKERRKVLKKLVDGIEEEIKSLRMISQKQIVLENRIILLLDTTQDSLFNALMSLVSQDTKDDQKYEYVDTSSSIKTRVNRFKGIPAIFTCQVVDDSRQVRYAEKNRRFIHVIPDTSSDKIQTAMDQIGLRYGLLPEEFDTQVVSREDKQQAKKICSHLVKKLIDHSRYLEPKDSGIKILFPMSITRSIMKNPNDVWGMTVVDRINKYLAVTTKMNMDNRPRLIDNEKEGKFYPISIFNDVKETLELMGSASSTLRPYIADWYNQVFIPAFKELNGEPFVLKSKNGSTIMQEIHVGLNTKQLGEKTAEVMRVSKPNSEDLLKHYLYPLLNLGIIDKVKSSIDGKANIYFPIEEGGISILFKDGKDPRLTVTDPTFYPSRKMLEDSCKTIVEYCSKAGGMKYRLVDHEGNDITVQEMVDRYLNNPEICFKEAPNENEKSQKSEDITTPPLVCGNKKTTIHNDIVEKSSIDIKGISSSQILSIKPIDFLFQKVHPGILDNNLHIEFVTSKVSEAVNFFRKKIFFACYYCYDTHKAIFENLNEYERHIVVGHKSGTVGYPGFPDIVKFEVERIRKKQGHNK